MSAVILVRNVFELHFGKAREALAVLAERSNVQVNMPQGRVLTDLTGPFYTVVLEFEFESLVAMEQEMGRRAAGWQDWYAKLTPLVRQGRREIYRIVE